MNFKLILISALITTDCIAQTEGARARLFANVFDEVMLVAGPSLVWVKGESFDGIKNSKIGYVLGLTVIRTSGSRTRLSFQMSLERKGFMDIAYALYPPDIYNNPPTYYLTPEPTELRGDLAMDYLTISLALQYRLARNSKVLLGIGPYLGKLIKSQSTRTDIQNHVVRQKLTVDQIESYKPFDSGLVISIGRYFTIKEKPRLYLNSSFNWGLVNVRKVDVGISSMRNISLSISFGYQILLNKN